LVKDENGGMLSDSCNILNEWKNYCFQLLNVQIAAELIQAGGKTLCSEIHKLISSVWNKEELPQD
jgi:hypothetical protein